MLKQLGIIVLCLFLLGATYLFAQGPVANPDATPVLKIGKVNSEAIYQSYPRFRSAEAQLQREAQGWQTERTKWEADMERLQNVIIEKEGQFKAGQAMFTDGKRTQMINEMDSLKSDIYARSQQRQAFEQERLQRRRSELLAEVLDEVNKVITKIGEINNFDIIIDSANGTVVYAKDPDELTDQVLQTLQGK